ncbi:glutaredoxin family protein [Acidovorax sp. LjRoot129]|uniref:glutaredoxin domain-containing protein n=1 Tax=Acidovorax sp. LjRoot129 TaxID=3342260 RepID=UPI003ECE89D2
MRPFVPSLLLIASLLAACLGSASAQTLYKSVGADGRVVYSDKPPVTGTVEKTLKLESLPVSVVPGAAPAPGAAPVAPVAQARGEVVLYMAKWCGYCTAAKAYMAGKGIAYRELDIDTPAGKTAFSQLGVRGIPVLLTQGQKISGFTPQAYDAVFMARK